ncbi:gliding motility lipoprotein GldB [Aquimarina brevivitae]|nr:gliding motility lipoprotein GldB [Aquimarina brevivitae]
MRSLKMKSRFKLLLLLQLLFCIFYACDSSSKIEKEIEKIPVNIKIERFDKKFAELTPQQLPKLKAQYPFLFPQIYSDSIWIAKSQDTLQQQLNEEVFKKFTDLSELELDIIQFLKRVKYYFPQVTDPRVITVTSDVDYRNKVILSNDLLLISLDTYLGEKHFFYKDLQQYITEDLIPSQILPDMAKVYAKQLQGLPKDRTLLSNMVYYGKELYLTDLFLPNVSNAAKMGYTEAQWNWVVANEEEIWRYFIDKQLLYSTDANLASRFLYPAPFSKFYLEQIDKESSDRVGQYIGWRIVDSYMQNNNVSLQQLLKNDAETIFKNSKYKPAR